jgi:hypothetical protein
MAFKMPSKKGILNMKRKNGPCGVRLELEVLL